MSRLSVHVSGDVRAGTRAEQALIAVALAGSAFLLAHLVAFGYGRDQGIYAVVAETMRSGGMPYRDAWDFKPPGIYFVYVLARALFGSGTYAIRILEAASLASLVWAFVILSRRLVGRAGPGVLGGALAVWTHVQLEFWNTAQPESFAAAALAWALVAATHEPHGGRAKECRIAALITAGALYGLAALMKPPLGGGALVSIAAIVLCHWRLAHPAHRVQTLFGTVLCFAVGGLLPVALTILYLWAGGALGDAYQVLAEFAPRYTALSWHETTVGARVVRGVTDWAVGFTAVMPAGVLLMVALPRLSEREREGCWHVGGVVAVALIGVVLQAKFFPYHYAPALALTCLLAGWGWWKLLLCSRQSVLGAVALLALLVSLGGPAAAAHGSAKGFWDRCQRRVTALLYPEVREAIAIELHTTSDCDALANRQLADWLRAETLPEAAIYIWGFEPVVYDWAQRRPASRFIYNVAQLAEWSSVQARATLMRDLEAMPPAVIIVEHDDRLPWVTGTDADSAHALAAFPALTALLAAAYEPAGQIARFDLYRRRTSLPENRPNAPAVEPNAALTVRSPHDTRATQPGPLPRNTAVVGG